MERGQPGKEQSRGNHVQKARVRERSQCTQGIERQPVWVKQCWRGREVQDDPGEVGSSQIFRASKAMIPCLGF